MAPRHSRAVSNEAIHSATMRHESSPSAMPAGRLCAKHSSGSPNGASMRQRWSRPSLHDSRMAWRRPWRSNRPRTVTTLFADSSRSQMRILALPPLSAPEKSTPCTVMRRGALPLDAGEFLLNFRNSREACRSRSRLNECDHRCLERLSPRLPR